MTVIRFGYQLAKHTFYLSNVHSLQPRTKLVITTMSVRYLSHLEITKNISLISNDKKQVQIKEFKLMPEQDNPLVVLYSWLMAKQKHVDKYAKIYTSKGFDVLNVRITPWQLLWPVKGSQLIARDVLKFLDTNRSYAPLFLHGFSVGAYHWSEVMVKIVADQPRYQHIIDRVAGQVWDSAADITEIPIGVPHAIFPTNPVMKKALSQYLIYHLKTFDKVATCHYLRASQMFHTNIIHAPALFFLSKTDPIGAEASNSRVRESWESNGVDCTWKIWDKSPHVGHMARHTDEYLSILNSFIERTMGNAMGVQQKMQAKAKL